MRKLAIASCGFSAAIFAAQYIMPASWLCPLGLGLICGFFLLLMSGRKWLLGAEIAVAALAFGFLWFCFFSIHTDREAQSLSGTTAALEARVLDYPLVYEDYSSVTVRLCGESTPKLKAILYADSVFSAQLEPGQYIHVEATLRSADTRYGEEYDSYYAKGIFLIANASSDIKVMDEASLLLSAPVRLRQEISGKMENLFPQDVCGFMKALVLGDKSELYRDASLYVDLNRAGLLHVAAVSGLHLSFLAGLIQALLGKTCMASLTAIPILWLFALVTGGSPSACRAAFMLTMLLLAPVLRRENDAPTSLTTVLALVLFANPYTAGSVSLQLSFGAMAGILCFYERIWLSWVNNLPEGVWGKVLCYPLKIVAVSLSVMIFTVPLTAIHFSTVAMLSPVSNVLGLWAISLCFTGGAVSCVLAIFSPALANAAVWLTCWAARYFFRIARVVSALSFAVVYLENPLMWSWLGLSVLWLLLLAFIKLRPGRKVVLALLLPGILLMQSSALAPAVYRTGSGAISVLDVGQGQSLAAYNKDAAIVIDCGGISSIRQPGEVTAAYLISRGVYSLDALLLTHLHRDHANGALMLMELMPVKRLYLPADPVDDENLLPSLIESAARNKTELVYVEEDRTLSLAGMELAMWKPSDRGDANERCVTAMLTVEDYGILVTGDASIAVENELVQKHDLNEADLLIVGHHGSRNSTGEQLLKKMAGKTAVISTGYNTFGHPTGETLERLAAYHITFYRTDLNGTVEIRP